MHDGWDDGLVDDSPPWVGTAALVITAVAVTAGALVVAAGCAVVDRLWRLTRR